MRSYACVLCQTFNNSRATECSSCGLAVPSKRLKSQPVAEAMVRNAAPRPKRRVRIVLAGFVCSLGIGLTFVSGHAALPSTPSDSARASDWREGTAALRRVLGKPSYDSFAGSFISVSFGHVVSFCGATDAKFDPDGTERYVVVTNSPSMISLEFRDPTFSTLWERACTNAVTASNQQIGDNPSL
jgi:hypothetical protein